MLRVGDKITIRYSKQLVKSGHSVLTNRTGTITKLMNVGNDLIGVYADVKVMRRMRNYFIPINSIEGPEDVNRIRSLSILKSTIL
jgi:hypothetical protein